MKIAKQRKSSVLASNAVHHRIDCLTSVVALIAIGGSHLFSGTTWLDPVGGLIVSFMVIRAGWGNTGQALLELADVGVDEEIKASVHAAATKALSQPEQAKGLSKMPAQWESQVEVRNVQGIKAGQNYLMEVELAVPETWELRQLRSIEDFIRSRIGSKVRGVRRVKVRMVPKDQNITDFQEEFIGADVSPRSSPEPEDQSPITHKHELGHKHIHEHDDSSTNGNFRERR